jgi:prolyl 4-hydroxylase
MIEQIPNFLSKKDCNTLIELIDKNHVRSSVAGGGGERSVYEDSRTSSTSMISENNPTIQRIKKRIAKKLGLNINQGEAIQGQLYNPGEYFRPHYDFFTGDSYINHCLASGNRIHTVMVYLNVPEEGGETDFPNLKIKVKPQIGKAISWPNMIDGKTQNDVIHEGTDVKKGKKYIITSWWREKPHDPIGDDTLAKEYWSKNETITPVKQVQPTDKIYTSKDDFPRIDPKGFKVTKVPGPIWGLINDAYKLLQNNIQEENWAGVKDVINTPDGELGSEMMSFDNLTTMRKLIHDQLLPMHQSWINQPLIPTMLYGIRSYKRGASLINHVDRLETHHVSSIIVVDKNLSCGCGPGKEPEDWPLHFQSHDGKWHKIYAEPGDMILYESATCMHGRPDPFKGTFYRNFYVHYQLKDWRYQP